jgi:hypothetical protein
MTENAGQVPLRVFAQRPTPTGKVALLVIAKAPVPGRSKTRLCPPCSFEEAVALAEASLRDTLDAVLATPVPHRVLVLDGAPGPWLPDGFDVIPQRGNGLGERLAGAFEDCGEPAFLVGMDTPQVTPALLSQGLAAVERGETAFGAAPDGGYWAIGLPRPDRRVFHGIPMSRPDTGTRQRERLVELGLNICDLPPLRDVDTFADARAVAAAAPATRFAAALAGLGIEATA